MEKEVIMNTNDLYFAKVKNNAIIPSKRDEDAGYDIYPCFSLPFIIIDAGDTIAIPTGIAVAMHDSKYMKLEERSSLAKAGIKISGGIIDSGYRGEILVLLYNTNTKPCIITKNIQCTLGQIIDDRIAIPYNRPICQGIIRKVYSMNKKEISYDELCDISSERGTGSFGSTDH